MTDKRYNQSEAKWISGAVTVFPGLFWALAGNCLINNYIDHNFPVRRQLGADMRRMIDGDYVD